MSSKRHRCVVEGQSKFQHQILSGAYILGQRVHTHTRTHPRQREVQVPSTTADRCCGNGRLPAPLR